MKSLTVFLMATIVVGCATPAAPKVIIPPDLKLICHNGEWAVISEMAEMGAIFRAPCGKNLL